MDKILSSVPAASWTPFTTKSATLGIKRQQPLPPPSCQSTCHVLGHPGETICHCMHVAISHLLWMYLKRLDLPPNRRAGLLLIASMCRTGDGALFLFIWIKWRPVGAGRHTAFWIIVKTATAWSLSLSLSPYCLRRWQYWENLNMHCFYFILIPFCHFQSWLSCFSSPVLLLRNGHVVSVEPAVSVSYQQHC